MNRIAACFALLAMATASLAAAGAEPRGAAPASTSRSLYQIDSAWTRDDGSAFQLSQLRGHPVVMAMIFTRCSSVCPQTVEEMKGLERSLPKAILGQARFVLVSFDSENDTPPVLRAYRQQASLDQRRWFLLRGNADQVRELAMVLGLRYTQVGPGLFSHSSLVTVLNREGEIVLQRPSLRSASAEAIQAMGGKQ